MDENNPPKNQSSSPDKPPGKDPAREAKQAADAKAEEVRAQVQSKGEQGKTSLGFVTVDPEDDQD